MWLFANDFKHRHIIYRWKEFSASSKNLRSLPQNKVLFGSNQGSVCTREHANFSGDETWKTWCQLTQNFMKIPKWLRSTGQATGVGWKALGLTRPSIYYSRRLYALSATTAGEKVSVPGWLVNAACVVFQWPEHIEPCEAMAVCWKEKNRKKKKKEKKKKDEEEDFPSNSGISALESSLGFLLYLWLLYLLLSCSFSSLWSSNTSSCEEGSRSDSTTSCLRDTRSLGCCWG